MHVAVRVRYHVRQVQSGIVGVVRTAGQLPDEAVGGRGIDRTLRRKQYPVFLFGERAHRIVVALTEHVGPIGVSVEHVA